jgi:hypothetical protein
MNWQAPVLTAKLTLEIPGRISCSAACRSAAHCHGPLPAVRLRLKQLLRALVPARDSEHSSFTFPGLVLASVLYSFPFAINPTVAGFRGVDQTLKDDRQDDSGIFQNPVRHSRGHHRAN